MSPETRLFGVVYCMIGTMADNNEAEYQKWKRKLRAAWHRLNEANRYRERHRERELFRTNRTLDDQIEKTINNDRLSAMEELHRLEMSHPEFLRRYQLSGDGDDGGDDEEDDEDMPGPGAAGEF